MSWRTQPRIRAISDARRVFRSRADSMACMSGTTDFTSITSSAAVPGWKARTSIEPRCPLISKVTSAMATQPSAISIAIVRSTRSACRASVSRSSASPCQKSRTSIRASSAAATRISVRTVTRSARPRSMREITLAEIPALDASRCWVHLRLRRRARIPSPNRTTSTVQGCRAPLAWRSSPAHPRISGRSASGGSTSDGSASRSRA